MSSKRRADDSEEKKKTWLQRRLDQRTHLVQELLDIRHAVKERGIAALPPRPKMPEEFYLNPRVAVGHLAASSDPGSLMDQLVRQMAQSLAPWLELVGDGSLDERRRRRLNALDQAESYVDLGDAEALEKLLEEHKDAFMDGRLSDLIVRCAERNQVECLDVCIRVYRTVSPEYLELRRCISIAEESLHDSSAIIHYAHAELVKGGWDLPKLSRYMWGSTVRNEKNGLALLAWDAKGDTAETAKFENVPSPPPPLFPRVRLLSDCTVGILGQTRFGVRSYPKISWPEVPSVRFTETDDHKFKAEQDVDMTTIVLEATEDAADVKGPEETYPKQIAMYGSRTRSGKLMVTGFDWMDVPKAMDIKIKLEFHRDDPEFAGISRSVITNSARDAICLLYQSDAVFALYGMLGRPMRDIEHEYVLDGSLWTPPSAEDMHGLPVSEYDPRPYAIIAVSADTGSVVGYLTHVDCPRGNGVFEDLRPLSDREAAERTLPLGLPSFTKEPVTDPAVQVFYASVLERGTICVANCQQTYIHYISDERVWDRVLSIVPFEKRARM